MLSVLQTGNRRISGALAVILLSILPQSVFAQENTAVQTFVTPKLLQQVYPRFPQKAQSRQQEGWVTLNGMVNTEGKVYDVHVAQSSGQAYFHNAAIKAFEEFRYAPATAGGKKIDARVVANFNFAFMPSRPSDKFSSRYAVLSRAIKHEKEARASKYLNRLKEVTRNAYEQIYFNFAAYRYYRIWGSSEQQYNALILVTCNQSAKEIVSDELMVDLLWARLILELKTNRLANARDTGDQLITLDLDDEQQQDLRRVQADISTVYEAGSPLLVKEKIYENNTTFHNLFRTAFSIQQVKGHISEIRLHCNRGAVGFPFNQDMTYSVNSDWQNCCLMIIGDAGTELTITEL